MTVAPSRSVRLEMLVWFLAAFVCFGVAVRWRPTPFADDSFQYLNVAENIRAGRGISTSLIHFDSERSTGRVPAPLTTFAPAYPMLVALLSPVTGSLESAGRLLSGIGYAGTAALLIGGLSLLGCGFLVRQTVLLLYMANAVNLAFATAVLTETSYMFVSTAAVLGLVLLETGVPGRTARAWTVVIACALTGFSYYLRYAGVFLVIAVCGYLLAQFLIHRDRTRAWYLAAAAIPVALAAVIAWRNVVTVGTWRGGNTMVVHHRVLSVVADYLRAHYHLILGEHAVKFGFWEALLIPGVLGVAAYALPALRQFPRLRASAPVVLIAWCVSLYSAGIFYAGLRTSISFGTRMFFPILPFYLLLLGILLSRLAAGRPVTAAILLGVVGYAGANARDLYQPRIPSEDRVVAGEFAGPASNGRPLIEWVRANLRPGDPIFAEDGQATGYFLKLPTITLTSPQYSSMRWKCSTIREEMGRFGARYLVLYKVASNADDQRAAASSDFLAAAASGTPSCGFTVAADNASVRILDFGGAME